MITITSSLPALQEQEQYHIKQLARIRKAIQRLQQAEDILTERPTDKLRTRAREAVQWRKQGLVYREIGEKMGVSRGRAQQLVLIGERHAKAAEHWASQLPVRAANCIRNLFGYELDEEDAFKLSGEEVARKLAAHLEQNPGALIRTPNAGRLTVEVIVAWLARYGYPLELKFQLTPPLHPLSPYMMRW